MRHNADLSLLSPALGRLISVLLAIFSMGAAIPPAMGWAHPPVQLSSKALPLEPAQTTAARPREPKDYEGTVARYKESLRLARQAGDKKAEADCFFYLGLTRQQQASAKGWGPEAQPSILEAEQYYKQALAIRPDSASTLNNLAQLYLRTGRKQEAEELLKKAVALGDSKQAFYAKNYGDLLTSDRDSQRAQQYYELAAKSQPENAEAHEKLVGSYLTVNPKGLGEYLWGLVKSGQVLRAQDTAISSLDKEGLDIPTKEELLTIAAVSLSKQYYNPSKFADSATGSRLARFVEDPAIGPGVSQILLLHVGVSFEPSRYRWWGQRGKPDLDPPRGVWPRDGFRQLIRTLGRRFQRQKDAKLAEQYYLLSMRLDQQEVDPEASLVLADLYVAQGRIEDLTRMLEQYAPSLFHGKGIAYRRSQAEKIYEYHRTLGVIYSYLGRWGSSGEPASAIFQLNGAVEMARELGCSPEPRIINFLAEAYRKTNQLERAQRLEQQSKSDKICGAKPSL